MIPDIVKQVISLPNSSVVASRDATLQPSSIRVFGVRLHPNETTVTFCIPSQGSEQIIADFEANGRVALTMDFPGTHDSYQMKGKFISWKRNSEDDDQFVAQYRSKTIKFMKENVGLPEEFANRSSAFKCNPGISVDFDVECVFGQAPHPDTGQRIT